MHLVTSEAVASLLAKGSNVNKDAFNKKARKSTMILVENAMKPQEKKIENDPLNLLGIGIVAQFNLMRYLIFAFIAFTLLSIPMIKIYSGHDAMRGTKKEWYTARTLGNFGFSTSS